MNRYIRVEWKHDFEDEPIVILSEIAAGTEMRKIEIYRNGRTDFADAANAAGNARLSETLMPSAEEISKQDEFVPEEINAETFEVAWQAALQADRN